MMKKRHTGIAALVLLMCTVFPSGPLNALNLSSISLVEVVPYSDDTLSFTAEETLIAGLSPVVLILARLQYRDDNGTGKTSVSAGPIIVFSEGLYAEFLYGAGFQGDELSHSLGLEVTREKGNTILAAGGPSGIPAPSRWTERLCHQYCTGHTGKSVKYSCSSLQLFCMFIFLL
jgi:hypothetical protein